MIEPDDFGLSPLATLAHVAAYTPPPMFAAFWTHWQQRALAIAPRLTEFRTRNPDPSDSSATHWVESIGHVRIGCRLVEPPRGTPTRGGLITLHAYHSPIPLSGEDEEWEPLARRGVLVVAMRVRGYPGSQLDCSDFTQEPGGWVSRGLARPVAKPQDAMDWSLPQGAADVFSVARALRHELDRRTPADAAAPLPLMMNGGAFGASLAVLAAAQLAGTAAGVHRVSRLALAMPSLGDWSWRLTMPERGARAGVDADVRATLAAHAARVAEITATLALTDATFHARHVHAESLCLLACRDDTAPAPCAAAVYNSLASDPGSRWRFLAPYGHFDGGIRNARRHALFPACREEFLDPGSPPEHAMSRWAPILERGERRP